MMDELRHDILTAGQDGLDIGYYVFKRNALVYQALRSPKVSTWRLVSCDGLTKTRSKICQCTPENAMNPTIGLTLPTSQSCLHTSLFSLSTIPQLAPKDLADCILRQFVDEAHTTSQLLVVRQSTLDKILHVVFAQSSSLS